MNTLENSTLEGVSSPTFNNPVSLQNKKFIWFLSFTTFISVAYSMYRTLFVIDNNAQDFVFAENMFWVTVALDLILPTTFFLIHLFRKISQQPIWLGIIFFLFLGPSTLFFPFFLIIGGGVQLILILSLYYLKKIYQLIKNPTEIKSMLATTATALMFTMVLATVLDLLFQHNTLYMNVLSDTMSHFTSTQTYSENKPVTINVIPLLFYCLIMTSIILETFFPSIIKKYEATLDLITNTATNAFKGKFQK